MSHIQRSLAFSVGLTLALITSVCAAGVAEETTLISLGLRVGFSGNAPLWGRQQKYNFELYDGAALFGLPWGWPLKDTGWKVEMRLITSVGELVGGGTPA